MWVQMWRRQCAGVRRTNEANAPPKLGRRKSHRGEPPLHGTRECRAARSGNSHQALTWVR